MLIPHAIVNSQRIYVCSCCLNPIDEQQADTENWMFCPCCGTPLWEE